MTFIFIDVEMQNDRPTIYNCRVADACVGQDAVVEIANAKLTSLAMAWSIIEHRLSASDRQTNSRAYERMTPNFFTSPSINRNHIAGPNQNSQKTDGC